MASTVKISNWEPQLKSFVQSREVFVYNLIKFADTLEFEVNQGSNKNKLVLKPDKKEIAGTKGIRAIDYSSSTWKGKALLPPTESAKTDFKDPCIFMELRYSLKKAKGSLTGKLEIEIIPPKDPEEKIEIELIAPGDTKKYIFLWRQLSIKEKLNQFIEWQSSLVYGPPRVFQPFLQTTKDEELSFRLAKINWGELDSQKQIVFKTADNDCCYGMVCSPLVGTFLGYWLNYNQYFQFTSGADRFTISHPAGKKYKEQNGKVKPLNGFGHFLERLNRHVKPIFKLIEDDIKDFTAKRIPNELLVKIQKIKDKLYLNETVFRNLINANIKGCKSITIKDDKKKYLDIILAKGKKDEEIKVPLWDYNSLWEQHLSKAKAGDIFICATPGHMWLMMQFGSSFTVPKKIIFGDSFSGDCEEGMYLIQASGPGPSELLYDTYIYDSVNENGNFEITDLVIEKFEKQALPDNLMLKLKKLKGTKIKGKAEFLKKLDWNSEGPLMSRYRLIDDDLKKLGKTKITDDIQNKIKELKDKEVKGESDYINLLESKIGKDNLQKFKSTILSLAIKFDGNKEVENWKSKILPMTGYNGKEKLEDMIREFRKADKAKKISAVGMNYEVHADKLESAINDKKDAIGLFAFNGTKLSLMNGKIIKKKIKGDTYGIWIDYGELIDGKNNGGWRESSVLEIWKLRNVLDENTGMIKKDSENLPTEMWNLNSQGTPIGTPVKVDLTINDCRPIMNKA